MKSATTIAMALFALASFPSLAQGPPPGNQPDAHVPQQNTPSTQASDPSAPNTRAESSVLQMTSVQGELVNGLDSKTAKSGDSVEVQTKALVKSTDGIAIPKGSKLLGHVIGVKPSSEGANSQVALEFDHLELKGGQSMPVHSQIESITPAGSVGSQSRSDAGTQPLVGNSSNPGTSAADAGDNTAAPAQGTRTPNASPAANGVPAPGTIVATSGKIAIRTTSVPGLMLASNAPGEQDPRMAQAAGILLGEKQDIHLDGGTQLVVAVGATRARTQ